LTGRTAMLVGDLAKRGDLAAVERSFEHILSFGNDLDLFPERSTLGLERHSVTSPRRSRTWDSSTQRSRLHQRVGATRNDGRPSAVLEHDDLGVARHGGDGHHLARCAGTRAVASQPPFPRWHLLHGRQVLGSHRRLRFYVIGGWIFAFLFFLLFASLGLQTWWVGAAAGLMHGLFLLAAALPLLPYIRSRMASEYDGTSATRQLEPPGFMGLNYGHRTPLTTLAGQAVYGAVLGGPPQLQSAFT
jgi:hypothetical protein